MSAYNNVKVWEVDETTLPRSRPSSPARGSSRPRINGGRPEDSRQRSERNEKLGIWARLIGVSILGVAMLFWPYGRSCGLGLAAYIAATIMVVVGGLWVVACTWISRMARTHGLAMIIALWGATLVVAEVLPRVGYARAQADWLCSAGATR